MSKKIVKAVALIIRSGLLLVGRKVGHDTFISIGGKVENGEGIEEALRREVLEETGLICQSIEYVGEHVANAVFDPSMVVHAHVFIVVPIGDAEPSGEIQELAWLDAQSYQLGMKLGSILTEYAIPELLSRRALRQRKDLPFLGRPTVAIDIDGTIRFGDAPVGTRVLQALRQLVSDDRIQLVLATARAYRGVHAAIGELADAAAMLVCCNGAICYKNGKTVFSKEIPPGLVTLITEKLKTLDIPFWIEYGDHFLPSDNRIREHLPYSYEGFFSNESSANGVVKISAIAQLHALSGWVESLGNQVLLSRSGSNCIDFMAAETGKHKAISRLLNSDEKEYLALGNDENDFDLLAAASKGVVVGDSLKGLEYSSSIQRVPANEESLLQAFNSLLL